MCYPGQVAGTPAEQAESLAKISNRLGEVIALWRRHGLEAKIVSGGSTPTAYQSHRIPQLTEIRPGTYIFNDRNEFLSGYCGLEDCAARVVCTVVSDAAPGQVVLDAGSKTLTSDRCVAPQTSGHGYIVEYPEACVRKLSEEHAQVDVTACDTRPRIGERVTVIPNHICPCVNLQDTLWVNVGDGVLEPWPVDARGKLS
jgi:D-serine deaminase-like pyridoxal phosphate-dependent protein